MRSPYHGIPTPYVLPSDVVYFHDWRYVDTGQVSWLDERGAGVPLWSHTPLPPLHLHCIDVPRGISLVAQRASMSDAVMESPVSTEMLLGAGSLIHEEGRYRLWYECWPIQDYENPASERMGNRNLLRYAESENGADWKMPRLGMVDDPHGRQENIVYGGSLADANGYHGGSVFVDPGASRGERYKIFHLGWLSRGEFAEYQRRRPDAIDPHQMNANRVPALFGCVSADGLKWTPIRTPLIVQNSDTHNVCCYDPGTGKYVAYVRSWFFNRRTIGRSESEDFRNFSIPEEILWPDASVGPHELWYGNAKTTMPGAADYHLMFPVRWDLLTDTFSFGLAASPDGIVWGRIPGGAVCEPGDAKTWYSGVVFPGLGMVNLPGERMGILVNGTHLPHKHPRCPPLGKLGWASWKKGRLVALTAPEQGSFKLFPLKTKGRTIHLNFRDASNGFIKVEAIDESGVILKNRSFRDCDVLNGDHIDRIVSWNGQSDPGHKMNSPIILRFQLSNAELFSVSFR